MVIGVSNMTILEKRDLLCQENGRDAEYHIQIISMAEGGFQVDCQWGRRGNTLQTQTKIADAGYDKAKKLYDGVVKEKTNKGYKDIEGGAVPKIVTPVSEEEAKFSADLKAGFDGEPEEPSLGLVPLVKRKIRWKEEALVPQLLNPIDESELEKYLKDDAWGMQEKMDGRHQMIRARAGDVKVYNKKGKEVAYPSLWADSLKVDCVIDGEAIGETYYVFDLLEVGGKDYRDKAYMDRWGKLIGVEFGGAVKVVPLAIGYEEKKALYDKLVAGKKEGVVFKRLDAVHKPGKAHSDMFKHKFYSTASVRVCKGREGKHSIGMEVLDGSKWVFVGNCTIPPNKEIPSGVVEIRYLYAYKGGSLYQPSFKEVRDDTDEVECVIGQLKYKAEED